MNLGVPARGALYLYASLVLLLIARYLRFPYSSFLVYRCVHVTLSCAGLILEFVWDNPC